MHDGSVKAVEDVLVGDLLMGPDSRPRRVESLARGQEMMYRVTPKRGETYVVNESHILSLKITNISSGVRLPSGETCRAGDVVNISVRDYLKSSKSFKHVAKGWRVAVDYPRREKPLIPPYVMGAWLGDGSSRHPSITTADSVVAKEFIKFGRSLGLSPRVEQNSCWSVVVHMSAGLSGKGRKNPFKELLKSYDLIQNKHIPDDYLLGSRSVRLQLLAGLIDTDGHMFKNVFSITQKSKVLANQIAFLARSLGFGVSFREKKRTCCNNGVVGDYFEVIICGHTDQVPCRMPRKQASPRRQIKDPLVTGISVEPVGTDDYYGFELSGPDRLFLLGDFTVTHNTVLLSAIAAAANKKGTRIIILAHRKELLKQISAALTAFGVEHGMISPHFTPDYRKSVQVASVQTMAARFKKLLPQYRNFDLAIMDETHHLLSENSFGHVYGLLGSPRLLGVTATPQRGDGKGLGISAGGLFETMVEVTTVRELINDGYLSDFTVFAPPTEIDMDGLKSRMGDWERKELASRMDKPSITGDAVKHYREKCPGVPAVAFCVSIEHCNHVAAQFRAAGYNFQVIDGKMPDGERDAMIKGLGDGTIQGLCSADLISEGTDIPSITCAIFLRPTKSLGLYIQQAGRALRAVYAKGFDLSTREGRLAAIAAGPKPKAIFLDHVGSTFEHGMIDEEREWSLEGIKKKKRKKNDDDEPRVNIAQCPKCRAAFAPAPKCPVCLYVIPAQSRKIEQVEGNLKEVSREMVAAVKRARRMEVGQAKTMEDLERIAAERGYKPGWAKAIYHSRNARQQR